MTKIFPHVLIRISSGALDELETLYLPESIKYVKRICSYKTESKSLAGQLSQDLYIQVGKETDNSLRTTLINVRRDIFNQRMITPETIEQIKNKLPKKTSAQLVQYQELVSNIAQAHKKFENKYNQELVLARKKLQQLAMGENFQKGLILSSQSLVKRGLPAYLGAKNLQYLTKKQRKVEHSLIKYLSRMYAKTSPFSTFTSVAIGTLDVGQANSSHESRLLLSSEHMTIQSHIRLNNYIYKYIKNLLITHKNIRRYFTLCLNPTMQRMDNYYSFLVNSNNIESFQKIQSNPALDFFYNKLISVGEDISFNKIVGEIIHASELDASQRNIEAYLNQLIEYGFLEFDIGISGIDPFWDIKLQQKLKFIPEKHLVDALLLSLSRIREISDKYKIADAIDRQKQIQQAFKELKSACINFEKEAFQLPESTPDKKDEQSNSRKAEVFKNDVFRPVIGDNFNFRPEELFYEDTTISAKLNLKKGDVEPIILSLCDIAELLRSSSNWREMKKELRDHFLITYGKDKKIELLKFYEDYYRELKNKQSHSNKKHNLPLVSTNNISELEIPDEQLEIDLEQNTITFQLTSNKEQGQNRTIELFSSYAAFIQLYWDHNVSINKPLVGVLNGEILPGYGKFAGRFLHLFDKKITEEFRRRNTLEEDGALLVENSDGSYFNANLHPALMPLEIWMPGGNNQLPRKQQVAVSELYLQYNEKYDQLELIHSLSGKRVYVFDMGFQSYTGRSQLFQLLNKLSGVEPIYIQPLLMTMKRKWDVVNKKVKNTSIHVIPRMMYGRHLVLKRRSWVVKKEDAPLRLNHEGDGDYFRRINEWRLQNKIPEDVFVKIYSGGERINDKEKTMFRRMDYKPQYICFSNPFLVKTFEQLINHAHQQIALEEMLPTSRQLLSYENEKRVTEFLFHWYGRKVNDSI